jgi:hypothetical protein
MATYKLSPDFLQTLRRRMLLTVPLAVFAVTVGIGVTLARQDASAIYIVLPIVAVALIVGLRRGYTRQVEQARTFEIELDADRLTRSMPPFPSLTLHRDDVTRIEEHTGGEITLHARERTQSLRIPADIERRDELLETLAAWNTIEKAGKVQAPLWPFASSILVIAAFAVTVTSENRLTVIIVGTLLFLALITCSVLLIRTKQLDAKTRRLGLVVLLPAIAVLVKVLSVL